MHKTCMDVAMQTPQDVSCSVDRRALMDLDFCIWNTPSTRIGVYAAPSLNGTISIKSTGINTKVT